MNRHGHDNSITRQYTRENRILQNNRNIQEITVPSHKIFGAKEKGLSKRGEAEKYYREAIERFIVAYQSYEKIRALLQKARVMGDLAKIEYLSHLHMENVNNLMYTINLMDQAKKMIKYIHKRYFKNL